MKTLVPIKMTVGINAKGHYDYPDFNSLPGSLRNDLDWSIFFDKHGGCMHYDKIQNIGKGADNEVVMTCVPENFAVAAATAFSNVEITTEAELENFFDNRSKVNLPDELIDKDRLDGLTARRALLITRGNNENSQIVKDVDAEIDDALDPNNTKPGVRKNNDRRWADFKVARGITIVTTS